MSEAQTDLIPFETQINRLSKPNSVESHLKVDEFMCEAEQAERMDDTERAIQLWRQAAEWEVNTFVQIPVERLRTRAIIGCSVVTLYFRAQEYEIAQSLALAYLQNVNPSFQRNYEGVLWVLKEITKLKPVQSDDPGIVVPKLNQ